MGGWGKPYPVMGEPKIVMPEEEKQLERRKEEKEKIGICQEDRRNRKLKVSVVRLGFVKCKRVLRLRRIF